MSLADPIFQMSEHEVMLRELFQDLKGNAAALDPDEVRAAGPMRMAPEGAQKFLTPSGKLEFYSDSLAAKHLPPMPDWREDPEEAQEAARWPLRLLTAPGYFQPHTTYSGVGSLRRREGLPVCILNPEDAGSRNLADGQQGCASSMTGQASGWCSRSAMKCKPAWPSFPGSAVMRKPYRAP